MEAENSRVLNGIPVQDISQAIPIIYEAAPPIRLETEQLHQSQQPQPQQQQQVIAAAAKLPPPTHNQPGAPATNKDKLPSKFSEFSSNKERFQAEISRWEEYYDQVRQSLSAQNSNGDKTGMPKSATNFSLGQDGEMYYAKMKKDGTVAYLKVVRDFADRVRLCREIHVDTGDVTLHNRRDRMLELVGQLYFWKGQRRDVCQCIAACDVCSAGLGAKRKAKPPRQKRDIPKAGPPDPPKKKAKIGRPRKSSSPKHNEETPVENSVSRELLRNVESILTDETISNIVSGANQQVARQKAAYLDGKDLQPHVLQGDSQDESSANNTLDTSEICFQQIFTTIDDENSTDQPSPIVQQSSQAALAASAESSVVQQQHELPEEGLSIYELLFKLPSAPSAISLSVMEAVHMAMRCTPDHTALCEAAESTMRQILSLGQGYNILVSPSTASAYTVAIFASMLRMDPLSVSGQICSKVSSPLAVLHDSCCALSSNSDLGPIKTCTALTGAYNWNLGDMTYPMDKDMVKMAIQSNRVAAVFYQPYAYIEKSQHITLEVLSGVCHSRGCDVAVIVDASNMPMQNINLTNLTAELRTFFELGADLVLMPSAEKLYGHSHACILVGVSSLLSKVWRSIGLLQEQVCLPLLCLPHDLVGTVVTYKALPEQ